MLWTIFFKILSSQWIVWKMHDQGKMELIVHDFHESENELLEKRGAGAVAVNKWKIVIHILKTTA